MMGAWRGLKEKLRGARGLEWLLLLIAAATEAPVIFPLSMASRIAWRLVPPPDTITTTLSIRSLPFLPLPRNQ